MSKELDAALAILKANPFDHDNAKAQALIVGYDEKWRDAFSNYRVMEVEVEFSFPLLNPKTKGQSKKFDEAGKMDAVLQHRRSNRFVVLEHKTTSDDIDPGSDYWSRLRMDTQCSKYILALHARGMETGNLLYDVIHKPSTRPHQIPLLDDDGVKVVLDADGARVRTLTGKKWRETGDSEKGWVLQTRQEVPQEYMARLLAEIRSDSDRYFAHREVPRLDTELLEYMSDAWVLSQEILFRRRFNNWSRNPDACMRFSKCEFYDLCTGRASVDGVRFRETAKHKELAMVEESRELLTNSRQTALRKCARYHYNRYEHPIEPCVEASDALRFGTLIHAALEAYFTGPR